MESLEHVLQIYGIPKIFNTGQGCQFTSEVFTGVLKTHGIAISMDGGRAGRGQHLRGAALACQQSCDTPPSVII